MLQCMCSHKFRPQQWVDEQAHFAPARGCAHNVNTRCATKRLQSNNFDDSPAGARLSGGDKSSGLTKTTNGQTLKTPADWESEPG